MHILYHEQAFVGIAKDGDSCYNFLMNTKRIYGYRPIIDERSRILVLGTMPSVRSLEEGFYYAHPRNAFWPIVAEAFGRELPRTVEEKTRLILENHLALWDVAGSCIREGSLDSAIREAETNDFSALFHAYPGIEKVLLNGGTAWNMYRRLDAAELRPYVQMPSTSPAYTIKYEEKLRIWKRELTGGGEMI